MKALYAAAVAALFGFVAACNAEDKKVTSPLSYTMKDIDGKDYDLSKLKGKVVLFVNVASECGLTPQYKGLQELYEKYEKDGFVIVGVPANEFGGQEPGTNEDIKKFCSTKYKVTFPMLSKVVVKGKGITPLYQTLLNATPDKDGKVKDVSWNFEKFLVGRDGKVVARFSPRTEPKAEDLNKAIKAELEKK
ncbi:MAG: glutathione peroxidase [Planctomycetes bacterium]|nr:glutathione peroxidase [Planctomycetota bacterium]